ncbi:MAG: hypothetical protein WB870_14370 [Gallionellaceae bacterium]
MKAIARSLIFVLTAQLILSTAYAEDTTAQIYQQMHDSIYGRAAVPAASAGMPQARPGNFGGNVALPISVGGQAQEEKKPWKCSSDVQADCAIESERFVSDMCSSASKTWVKNAEKWNPWQIGFTVLGVGATVAAASALATAKLYGVLAGSSGLAANMNTIATSDISVYQANLTSIRTTLAAFTTYATNTTSPPTAPQLQVEALSDAAACLMATNVAPPSK